MCSVSYVVHPLLWLATLDSNAIYVTMVLLQIAYLLYSSILNTSTVTHWTIHCWGTFQTRLRVTLQYREQTEAKKSVTTTAKRPQRRRKRLQNELI